MDSWKVVPSESVVSFSVLHMMVSNVTGTFSDFSGELNGDPADLTKSSIQFDISVGSIHTNNKERDAHLCSSDFFEAEVFPQMSFCSRSVYWDEQDQLYHATGDLTIKQMTKKALFCITPLESGPYDARFQVEGQIKRKDFGLTWNRAIEAGGVMVGDMIEVKMTIVLEHSGETGQQASTAS